MRKVSTVVLMIIAMIASFEVGRRHDTAKHDEHPTEIDSQGGLPRWQVTSNSEKPSLSAAFEGFMQAQRHALEIYRQSPYFESSLGEAEAYRSLLYTVIGSIKAGALTDPNQPRFMRAVDWTSKAGLENPDNNYYIAFIDDQGVYRMSGYRGSTADMVVQLVAGQPGVGDAGTSRNISIVYGDHLIVDASGYFEILIGGPDPGPEHNWMANGDGAESLFVRFTHADWTRETHLPLAIERLDSDGRPSPPLSTDMMIRGLDRTARSIFDRTVTWVDYANNRMWANAPRNGLSAPRATQGGMVGQYSAFGSFDLTEGDALLVEFQPTNAPYFGMQLGNLWFTSLEYESHTSSLNHSQLACDSASLCQVVISEQDPGITNWLDTEGHQQGLIFLRWQGLEALPSGTQAPTVRRIKLAELGAHLDPSTVHMSLQERREQQTARRAAVHRRFGG